MSEHDKNTVNEDPDQLTDDELDLVAGGFNPFPAGSQASGLPIRPGTTDGGFEFDMDADTNEASILPFILPRP